VIPPATPIDDPYHYTSSSLPLDSMVPQMTLRLGLVEFMNAPYESRPRYPNLSIAEGVPELEPLLRRQARHTPSWDVPRPFRRYLSLL